MLWLLILASFSSFIFIISDRGNEATPLQVVRDPLSVGENVPYQGGRQVLLFLLTQGLLTHLTPPLFCLALPTMTQFHEWSHSL